MSKTITVTEKDCARIKSLLEGVRSYSDRDGANFRRLHESLSSAAVVSPREIPEDTVTMNSRVSVSDPDTGKEDVYTLVYPEAADYRKGFISILAPLGMALIGSRIGDMIRWEVPKGEKRLEITGIIYQPETSGDIDI